MLQRCSAENGLTYYASPLLSATGVRHAFSTRLGGVSPAPFDSLNLGNPSGCDVLDAGDRIERNYALLQEAIRCSTLPRCRLHQVHGAMVHRVRRNEPFESGQKGDALISDDPERVIAIRIADCVPVLLSSDDGTLVAAVHSGWRGVVANVVGATVHHMLMIDAALTPPRLRAAIGPCIGFDAFEVGPEVVEAFTRSLGTDAPVRLLPDGKGRVDLRGAVRLQLLRAGLGDGSIDTTDRCTHRDGDEFFSHRRERGLTGRMAALISPGRAR